MGVGGVHLAARRKLLRRRRTPPRGRAARVTRHATALEMGGILAWMSGRILGQYDPFGGPGGAGRRRMGGARICPAGKPVEAPGPICFVFQSKMEQSETVSAPADTVSDPPPPPATTISPASVSACTAASIRSGTIC